jgi:hypothetical protein
MAEPEAVRRAYERKFYDLLMRVFPSRPEVGVRALMRKAEALAAEAHLSLEAAYERTYRAAEIRTEKKLALMRSCLRQPRPR